MHVWVIIGPGNVQVWCQAFTLTSVALLSIGLLGIKFNKIWIKMQWPAQKMHLKILSAIQWQFHFQFNVLN